MAVLRRPASFPNAGFRTQLRVFEGSALRRRLHAEMDADPGAQRLAVRASEAARRTAGPTPRRTRGSRCPSSQHPVLKRSSKRPIEAT